jgi:hypothetical protein
MPEKKLVAGVGFEAIRHPLIMNDLWLKMRYGNKKVTKKGVYG